jgi:hypothetical protein
MNTLLYAKRLLLIIHVILRWTLCTACMIVYKEFYKEESKQEAHRSTESVNLTDSK